MIYELPIFFQAIQGVNPEQSGIRNLPLIFSSSIASLASGRIFSSFRYPRVFLFCGAAVTAVGAGMIYTLDRLSSVGEYVGYQILFGVGVGICLQVPLVLSQSLVLMADISSVTGLIMCGFSKKAFLDFQTIGFGAISVSVSQSILTNTVIAWVVEHVTGVTSDDVVRAGSSDLAHKFTEEQLPLITFGYERGLKAAWVLPIATAGTAAIVGIFIGAIPHASEDTGGTTH
ncbi:MFS general substrate transporter [Colletotrichum asianum]